MNREELLKKHGWVVECQSPFEICHEDGSWASQQAAHAVVRELEQEEQENHAPSPVITVGPHTLKKVYFVGLSSLTKDDKGFEFSVMVAGVGSLNLHYPLDSEEKAHSDFDAALKELNS